MKIGVLALQGDVREHFVSLQEVGATPIAVRRLSELESIDALVLPGGESTTVALLARTFGLFDRIQERIAEGLPVYGSCAGMILLADQVLDATENQETFGGLDITVRRNAFGRQVDSFESDITFRGLEGVLRAVFIRAPWVERIGPEVEVLASVNVEGVEYPVAVRQGALLGTSFHPELTNDYRIHRYFLEEVCGAGSRIR
ncbi:MAG: pyridoxal 5'-phosphate synthase glutaminase subunit PdxT [Candidatus Nanopelagicaceae bacterium]|nr:pyridoxal 5'-phosphate synthase glutaminase subunit PdxT [Candidatus Nanopelagicaceae bacterium]